MRARLITGLGLTLVAAAVTTATIVGHGAPAAAVAADAGIEITSVDTSAYPEVTAIVAAPPGAAGAGLAPETFTVSEDGTPVKATVERIATTELEVMLLLDTSGSMRHAPLLSEQAAATEFLTLLPPDVRVGVLGYGTTPGQATPPTTDRALAGGHIALLQADGDTALYDAVLAAVAQFTPQAQRRAIVLLTDGEDNASQAPLEAAVLAAADVPIHVIELVTERSDRPALDALAAAGGGSVAAATDPAAIADLYRRAAGNVVNQYRVRYRSAGAGPVELAVGVPTPAGPVTATTTIELPAPPATTTTQPATTTTSTTTTTTTTTTPPTTTTTVVATTAAPTTTARPAIAPPGPSTTAVAGDAGPADDGRVLLLGGAAATFVGLLALGWLALCGERTRRHVRNQLGLSPQNRSMNVAQLKDSMSARVEGVLERRGRSQSLAATLEAAGIALRPGELGLLVVVLTTVIALVGLMVVGPLGALAAIVLSPLVTRVVLRLRASGRRSAFAEQLPETLQLLTSGLKAGHGLGAALDNVAQEAPEPTRTELRRVVLESRVGRDLSEALDALATRMASRDFEWVVGAIDINREIGGDLANTLDNVAETIRERQFLARQVKALTAEGRMSAYVLTGIPVLLGVLMHVINPGYLAPLFSGAGVVLLGVAGGMLSMGWFWMSRLIKVEL